MNARTVGAGDIGGAIILQSKASRGEGGRATNAAAGAWDGAGIQRMDTFVNTAGSSEARGPDGPVAIVGNTIRQTIAGIERFSDAGFGALWSNAGPVDPLVGSLIGAVDGVQVSGDWQGVAISANACHGARHAIRFKGFDDLGGVAVAGNVLERFGFGIVFEAGEERHIRNVIVTGNTMDGDPFFEDPDHAAAAGGGWLSTGEQPGCAFLAVNIRGGRFSNNVVRNVRKVLHAGPQPGVDLSDNDYHWDFVAMKGIGLMDEASGRPMLNRHFWEDGTPQSARFRMASAVVDSAYLRSAAACPETGTFRAGQFVACATLDRSGETVLRGWLRLTTGSGHVPGIDWVAIRDRIGPT